MKKIMLLIIAALAIGYAAKQDILAGVNTVIPLDTIIVGDSIKSSNLNMWADKQRGFYNLTYFIQKSKNNVKVKLYVEETFDTLYGYFNRTLIDSCVAAESTLMKFDAPYLSGAPWSRFVVKGFGAAGDCTGVFIQLQPIAK